MKKIYIRDNRLLGWFIFYIAIFPLLFIFIFLFNGNQEQTNILRFVPLMILFIMMPTVLTIFFLMQNHLWYYLEIKEKNISLKRRKQTIKSYKIDDIRIGFTVVKTLVFERPAPCLIIEQENISIKSYLDLKYARFYHKEIFNGQMLVFLNKKRFDKIREFYGKEITLPEVFQKKLKEKMVKNTKSINMFYKLIEEHYLYIQNK